MSTEEKRAIFSKLRKLKIMDFEAFNMTDNFQYLTLFTHIFEPEKFLNEIKKFEKKKSF